MVGSKYEREIRFIGNFTNRLTQEKKQILAKGELTDEDKKRIAEIDADVERYLARKKEIEDSYIESGLELPLATRNLNASVYAMGPSFEPIGKDYRASMIEETNARNAIAAKAYEAYEVPESEDIDELNEMVQEMTTRLTNMESKIIEADMKDDMGEKVRLQEEANLLRSKRDNTINKIKALKMEGARSANMSGVSIEFQQKIRTLEDQNNSLRSQVFALRSEIYNMRDTIDEILRRLGMSRNDIDDYNRDD